MVNALSSCHSLLRCESKSLALILSLNCLLLTLYLLQCCWRYKMMNAQILFYKMVFFFAAFNSTSHRVVCIWKSSKNYTMKVTLVLIAPCTLLLTLTIGPLCPKMSIDSSTNVMFSSCPRVHSPMLGYTYPCQHPLSLGHVLAWTLLSQKTFMS